MDTVTRGGASPVIVPQGAGATINWERLAHPVSEAEPAGVWLRYEGVYDAIKDARRADDPSLPQGVWQSDLKRADWPKVIALCLETLATRSKDLQLGAWLTEALLHQYGFAGCADGFQVLQILVDRFWDTLYPPVEESDLSARINPLEWLNDKLPPLLRLVALTAPSLLDERVYCLADWISATQQEKRRGEGEPEPLGTAHLLACLQASPQAFGQEQLRAVRRTLERLGRLENVLRERCGASGPGLGRIQEELRSIERLYAHLPWADDPDEAADDGTPAPSGRRRGGRGVALGGVALDLDTRPWLRSRDAAYTALAAIADYLMTVEPHSPAPHLVRRAVAWGRKPLAQLLVELLNDGMDLQQLQRLLNMEHARPLDDDSAGYASGGYDNSGYDSGGGDSGYDDQDSGW